MKVTHIYHSGFLIEINNYKLIFDCVDLSVDKYLRPDDKVYVFVTHSHSDHFSTEILKLEEKVKKIKYILSDDIKIDNIKNNYYFINSYNEITIDDLVIKTFGTTDRGLSFLVKTNDKTIFHAGDLNWWHWENDSLEEQKKEADDYKREVDKLTDEKIDIAFIPVDPRLKEYYYLSSEYFINTIKPSVLIPMHFRENFNITKELKNKFKKYKCEIIEINKKYHRIELL